MTEDGGRRMDQADVNSQLAKLAKIFNELTSVRFYGSVLTKFEAGKIVYVKKEESIKLDP